MSEVQKGARAMRVGIRSLLTASVAVLAVGSAYAQQAGNAQDAAQDDSQYEEIVVTGFRASLEEGQDNKRNAPNVIESIVAEDIAKLPDLNVAETLQRIPGVAVSREGGEGRNITLRGFAPDFTRTTLNGMEVPASSDGLDSGGFTLNAGRAFDFHLFASELFTRIDVQKSQRASIEEGGIAGTVDLYSAKPLDYDKPVIVLSAQAGYNSQTEKVDPRFTALVSDTFADGTLGVLLSAAYSKRTVQQQGFGTVRWTSPYANGDSWADTNPTVIGTVDGSCGAADPLDCLWAPRLPRADYFGNDQERIGLAGSIQFKPSDSFEVTLDVLHSELDNDRYSYNSMEWLLTHGDPGNYTGQTPLEFVVGPDGRQIVAAKFDDVTSWYESRHQTSKSKFNQVVLSTDFQFTDRLKGDAMVGWARDSADRYELRFYARSNPHYYAYDFRDNPLVAAVDYGSFDPNDPNSFVNATTAAHRTNDVDKENVTAKGNLSFEMGRATILAGGAFSDRTVRYREASGSAADFAPQNYLMPFPISTFGNGIGSPGLVPFAVIDFNKIDSSVLTPGFTENVGAGWDVGERTAAGYIEVLGSVDVGGMELRYDAGVRYVKTMVRSSAVVSGIPVKVTNDYDNWLPSANLALNITPSVVARAAYARSMTRPSLGSLNIAGPQFGYTTRTVSNIGNPNLKPYESNDLDFSLEWYTPGGGLIAVGYFNKDIVRSLNTQIITQMIDPVYWPAIYADPQYDPSYNADPAVVPYTFSIPVNNEDGNSVKGVEVTLNQPFTFLPGALQYFGIAANYTHVSARDSTGLSPNSYNATVYYDHSDFGARVSVNKRDDYLLSQPGGNGHVQERKYGPTHVDFSAFYNITDQFTVTLEGINITNEKEVIYGTGEGDQYLFREYSRTGAQWFLGLRFTY